MTIIEQLRYNYLAEKHPEISAEQLEFIVRTGLTFDVQKFKEAKNGNIDWYYPKGAAFKTSENPDDSSDSSDTDEPTDPNKQLEQDLSSTIESQGATFIGDDDSNDNTPSTIDVITITDENGGVSIMTTSDGEIIETND